MNRRSFLRLFGAAAAVALVDPERLAWKPGATTHVLPPPQGWRPPNPLYGLFNPPANLAQQYRHGLMLRHDAFELSMPPERFSMSADQVRYLEFYRGDQWPKSLMVARDPETGISMRLVDTFPPRIDILYGYAITPRLMARVKG